MKEQTGSMWPPLLKVVWRGWKPERHGQALSSRAGILNTDLRRSVKQARGSQAFMSLKPKTPKEIKKLCFREQWFSHFTVPQSHLESLLQQGLLGSCRF